MVRFGSQRFAEVRQVSPRSPRFVRGPRRTSKVLICSTRISEDLKSSHRFSKFQPQFLQWFSKGLSNVHQRFSEVLTKLQGSQRFSKVLQGSQRSSSVLEGSPSFSKGLEGSRTFPEVLGGSRRFTKVLQGSPTFYEVP